MKKWEFCERIERVPANAEAGRKTIKLGTLHGHALHAVDDTQPPGGLVPSVRADKIVFVSAYQARHAMPTISRRRAIA